MGGEVRVSIHCLDRKACIHSIRLGRARHRDRVIDSRKDGVPLDHNRRPLMFLVILQQWVPFQIPLLHYFVQDSYMHDIHS